MDGPTTLDFSRARHDVRGRWEGKGGQASQLWSKLGHGFQTPATGAVDDGKRASSAIEVESKASATQGRGFGGGSLPCGWGGSCGVNPGGLYLAFPGDDLYLPFALIP